MVFSQQASAQAAKTLHSQPTSMRKARREQLQGFDALFRKEYEDVARAAYLITGDRSTATEVAQDAFTQAVVHWKKVQTYEKPGAWVRRVAIRQAVKVRQRDQRRRRLSIQASNETEDIDDQPGQATDLTSALDVLSPRQRAIVVLHYFDGLAVNEAAEMLGCRPATASVHLHRARQRLGQELGRAQKLGEAVTDA